MKMHHRVENVCIENSTLILTVDGNTIQRKLKDISPRLAAAKE
jgi:hypothetical protein